MVKHKLYPPVKTINTIIMEQEFEAVLTGTDTTINGLVTENNGIYEFNAIDGSLQLTIARNQAGHWERVAGSEPYLSSWIDELSEQIQAANNFFA